MNKREKIKQDMTALGLYDRGYLSIFRRMYSPDNLLASISDVVDNMPNSKLSLAASQIANTLAKHVKV